MAHRANYGGMQNFPQFSVLPYFVDPEQFGNSKYLLNHQQAHFDMLYALPLWASGGRLPTPPIGILPDQNLYDTTGNQSWWLFAHHMEHFTTQEVLPQPEYWTFPFW